MEWDEEDPPPSQKKRSPVCTHFFFFLVCVAPKTQTLAFLLPPSFTSQTTNGKGKETT